MRRNVFVKSMLRQPVRSALLFFLIALAAFAFVLRTVEYVTVRGQILEIAGFYQSIGVLTPAAQFGDVSPALAILENSPNVDFIDTRRGFDGILQGMNNFQVEGNWSWTPRAAHTHVGDTIFYAYFDGPLVPRGNLTSMHQLDLFQRGGLRYCLIYGDMWLDVFFVITEVVFGYEEHAYPGHRINTTIDLPTRVGDHNAPGTGWEALELLGLEQYDYFLIRALYTRRMWPDAPVPIRPSRFWGDMLVLYPLNAELGIDKMSLAHGERVDFTEPELAHLPELMWQWHWEMRRMYVSTVTDMSIMQKMASNPIMLITEGRQITMDDYREARPVAVIHREFARERDLPIGSILTIDIPRYQYYDGIFTGAGFSDILVRSQIAEQPYHLLELEIIGHFVFRPDGARLRELAYVFVPDSLIPAHIVVNTPETGPMANWQPDHIPNHMMTFLLADTRAEQGFEMAYFERFAELGLQLNVVGANSGGFWALADPILMIIAFNAVVFWVVLLMVMALVVFLFLRQRRRDFAILRALGASRGLVMWRLFVAALVLGIPAVALGGGLAWIFGNATAADTMAPLMELQGIGIMPPLGLVWLMGFFGIVLGLMLIMALSGGARILSQPVLVLLQNQQAKYSFAKAGVVGGGDGLNAPDISQLQIALPKDGLQKSFKWRMGNNFRWIRRHISRAPAKAALGLAVALFFVLALGWLQEAIDRTQNDIDRFYNETVVSGQLRAVGTPAGFGAQMIWGGAPGDHVGGFIHSRTRRALMGLEFIERFHMESGHTRSIIIPYGDGVFDNNWFDHVEFDLALATHSFQNLLALDFLHGVNDYDLFISEHSGFLSADMPDIEITFAPGFDGSMFDRVEQVGSIMPIVLYQGLLEQWGFELGDSVFLVFARGRSMLNHEHRRAIIAGVHNGHIYRTNLNDSVVMNLQYKESFMGMMTIYLGIAFDIDTAYNRDLEYVRDSLTHAIFSFEAGPGLAPLGLFLEDEEMRNVIAAMEQSLLLLELLYPIAIALAVAIGAGLSMLLMLQGVRNAAIMRVLGGTRRKTSGMLITEQLLISAIGIFAGFLVLVILSWGFGAIYSLQIAAVYLAGAVVGSIAGAIVVTGKAPLDLLQVRE